MFGKKVLSLVTLLFLGSQVTSVFGEPIVKCTSDQHSVTLNSECVVSGDPCFDDVNNKVYYFNSETCKKVADGAFVVDSNGAIINLGTDAISTSSTYALYYCNGSACTHTIGYVKNGASYYLIKNGANAEDGAPANVSGCNGKVGSLIQPGGAGTVYLCLTQEKKVGLDGDTTGSYLSLNLNTFELAATAEDNTKVVITGKANALVLDTLYTDAETHCYDASNASIMPRIDNFCEGTDCDKYYLCTAGVCTLQKDVCPRGGDGPSDDPNSEAPCDPTTGTTCEKGYYLYNDGLKVKDEDTGTFYVCDGKKEGACSTTIPSKGYFVNAAYNAETALTDTNHNAQYIKCTGTINPTDCTAINVSSGTCTKDGLLYESGSDVYLCLDGASIPTVQVKLGETAAEDTDYFIKASASDNLFDNSQSGNYILININEGNVTPSETDNSSDQILYKYAGNDYQVLEKGDGVCNYNGILYEFGTVCSGSDYTNNYVLKNSKTVEHHE